MLQDVGRIDAPRPTAMAEIFSTMRRISENIESIHKSVACLGGPWPTPEPQNGVGDESQSAMVDLHRGLESLNAKLAQIAARLQDVI